MTGGSPASFSRVLDRLDLPALTGAAADATDADVLASLRRDQPDLRDLAVLLSPAGTGHLEEMATRARAVTVRRFGRVIRLFAPLYLSNHCLSTCTYCGFARNLDVARRHLSPAQVTDQGLLLAGNGFRHVLLVAGEDRVRVSEDYLVDCVGRVSAHVPSVSVETQTWSPATYARLVAAGTEGVVHYQETYDRHTYRAVHPAGWKRDFDRRLRAMEDAGRAGARRLGLGVLVGLAADWRSDVLALAAHADHLFRAAWRSEVTLSLPRITASASGFRPRALVSDTQYVQALAALRLFAPDAGIVLSTRERAPLRDGLARIAVTHMSAGSSTEPGGYTTPGRAQEQFSVADTRSLREVSSVIESMGYEAVVQDALPPRGWAGTASLPAR